MRYVTVKNHVIHRPHFTLRDFQQKTQETRSRTRCYTTATRVLAKKCGKVRCGAARHKIPEIYSTPTLAKEIFLDKGDSRDERSAYANRVRNLRNYFVFFYTSQIVLRYSLYSYDNMAFIYVVYLRTYSGTNPVFQH